jgi:hypothetical protein
MTKFGVFTVYRVLGNYSIHENWGLGFILESEIWVCARGWWQIQADRQMNYGVL